jgi:hypothetical protein
VGTLFVLTDNVNGLSAGLAKGDWTL